MSLKTQNYIIRPLNKSDYKNWASSLRLCSLSKNKWDVSYSENQLTKNNFIKKLTVHNESFDKGINFYFYVFRHSQGKSGFIPGGIVGTVSLMDVQRSITQSACLGYRVFNPYWRQGVAFEVLSAFVPYAFKKYKLHRLEAGIEKNNVRSMGLVKKLGFRREGIKRRMVYLRNHWQDLTIFAKTIEDLNNPKLEKQFHKYMQNFKK